MGCCWILSAIHFKIQESLGSNIEQDCSSHSMSDSDDNQNSPFNWDITNLSHFIDVHEQQISSEDAFSYNSHNQVSCVVQKHVKKNG